MNVRPHRFCARFRFGIAAALFALPAIALAQDVEPSSNPAMSMEGMPSMPMQGASSPTATTPHDQGSMQNMDMHDDAPHGALLVDQWEYTHAYDGNGTTWEAEGWYGGDSDKLWLRSEGNGSNGRLDDGDLEILWSHAASAFWDTQWGVRQDLGTGSKRTWMAAGIEGLAPYWVELEATAYVAGSGRLAARMRAEYTLRFTQRWMLQPELELNAYSRDDASQRVGSGVSNAQLGLRLRYEINRQFAPYIGVAWTRRFAATADFAQEDRVPIFDRQWVVGVRLWF
jgi:copper resistance protein B